jgi:hypothetical protein
VPATGAVRGTQLRGSLYVTRSLVLKQPASPPVAILDSLAKQRNRQAVCLMQPAQRARSFCCRVLHPILNPAVSLFRKVSEADGDAVALSCERR